MFRYLAVTGRSRLGLCLARIPAGLSILLSLAAAGFTVAALATAFLGGPEPASLVAALGDGRRHRRLDPLLARHRRLEDGHP